MNRCPVHIGEGGAYGCPVFRIFGDQETDAIHFFQLREDFLALLKEDIRTKKINPAALK